MRYWILTAKPENMIEMIIYRRDYLATADCYVYSYTRKPRPTVHVGQLAIINPFTKTRIVRYSLFNNKLKVFYGQY